MEPVDVKICQWRLTKTDEGVLFPTKWTTRDTVQFITVETLTPEDPLIVCPVYYCQETPTPKNKEVTDKTMINEDSHPTNSCSDGTLNPLLLNFGTFSVTRMTLSR